MKNFISKSIAIIASKESKENFDNLINIIIENLNNSFEKQNNQIDNYLRLLINILRETDNTVFYITGKLIPLIMKIFECSNVKKKFLF